MNCFSAYEPDAGRRSVFGRIVLVALLASPAACSAPASEPAPQGNERVYRIDYRLTLNPLSHSVDVELDLYQPRDLLREMRFSADRVESLSGDGEVRSDDGEITWRPPADGGTLSWRIEVRHRRDSGGYDAWLAPDWGLFRAEDVIPRAATRTLKGARSQTRLHIDLPPGWSAVTQYREDEGRYRIDVPERRFSQPSGWIVAGRLGVRRDRIAGIRVAVAGPEDQGVRRLDMLALMNWTLPELVRILPDPPDRLTIFSAGEPMWEGGLSAPESVFVHADQPLISENGTSLLLHEIMHLVLDLDDDDQSDWILEGLAEFYSIELLRRSGTLTEARFYQAIESQRSWSAEARTLCGRHSTGATTALAVTIFKALDDEIRRRTDGEATLDDVVGRLLLDDGPTSVERLRAAAADIAGEIPDALHGDALPGCRIVAQSAGS